MKNSTATAIGKTKTRIRIVAAGLLVLVIAITCVLSHNARQRGAAIDRLLRRSNVELEFEARELPGWVDATKSLFPRFYALHVSMLDARGKPHLSEEDYIRIGRIGDVERVELTECGTTDRDLVHLSELHRLKCLIIRRCEVTDLAIARVVENNPDLTSISVNNTLSTGRFTEHLLNPGKLKGLAIHGVSGDLELHRIEEMGALRSLAISNGRISIETLNKIGCLPSLESLEMVGCEFEGREFSSIKCLPQLVGLSLGSAEAEKLDLDWLDRCVRLERLEIEAKSVSVANLASINLAKSLKTLIINTRLLERGALEQMACSNIKDLQIVGCEVSREDSEFAANSPSLEYVGSSDHAFLDLLKKLRPRVVTTFLK